MFFPAEVNNKSKSDGQVAKDNNSLVFTMDSVIISFPLVFLCDTGVRTDLKEVMSLTLIGPHLRSLTNSRFLSSGPKL